jgi:hypothetical protein
VKYGAMRIAIILWQERAKKKLRTAAEHGIKEHGKTKKDMVKSIDKLKEFIYTMN